MRPAPITDRVAATAMTGGDPRARLAAGVAAGLAVVLLAACAGERDLSGCALAVHAVDAEGRLVQPAALTADDVRAIRRVQEAHSGERAWEVQLTAEGARTHRAFSAAQVGRPVAILCDGAEVARPLVMDESGESFVFFAGPQD